MKKGHAFWEGAGMIIKRGCSQDSRWSVCKSVIGESQSRWKGNDGSHVEFKHRQNWSMGGLGRDLVGQADSRGRPWDKL